MSIVRSLNLTFVTANSNAASSISSGQHNQNKSFHHRRMGGRVLSCKQKLSVRQTLASKSVSRPRKN